MTTEQKLIDAVRNAIGNVDIIDQPNDDNLAIALCCYFTDRHDCPDEPNYDETGWKPSVVARVNDVLNRAAKEAVMTVARMEKLK
jgi:hypothetical protein